MSGRFEVWSGARGCSFEFSGGDFGDSSWVARVVDTLSAAIGDADVSGRVGCWGNSVDDVVGTGTYVRVGVDGAGDMGGRGSVGSGHGVKGVESGGFRGHGGGRNGSVDGGSFVGGCGGSGTLGVRYGDGGAGDAGLGSGVDGGPGGMNSVEVRGRHYRKNRNRRLRNRRLGESGGVSRREDGVSVVSHGSVTERGFGQTGATSASSGDVSVVGAPFESGVVQSKGFFSGCSEGVVKELRETRAKRYVEENKLSAAKAAAAVEDMVLEKKTRLNEARFELKRQRVEVKLAALQEKRLGGSTQDWVESLLSGVDEPVVGTPPLSVGSVSPNSSISVEQEKVLRGALDKSVSKIRELEMQLSKFTGVLRGKALVRKGTPDPYEGCFSDPPSIGVGDADFF